MLQLINTFTKLYLAWTTVSFVNCCLRTAGICFLAVASSFLRGSAHLRGLVYVSSENKRTGDTPESTGERRKTEADREKTEVPHAGITPSWDLYWILFGWRSVRTTLRERWVVRINNGAHRRRIGVYLPNQWLAQRITLALGNWNADAPSMRGTRIEALVPSPIYSLGAKLRERSRDVYDYFW